MPVQCQKLFYVMAVALVAMGATLSVAQADDDGYAGLFAESRSGKYGGENRGKHLQSAQLNLKYRKECSDCHIAYAPGLMSAESWRRVMAGLDRHFGTDASLYAEDNKEITDFLVNNASSRWSASTAPLRISEAAWFKHKHDSHEISPAVWKSPKVKSPSNCVACHPQAELGDFDEHGIVLPK